MSKEKPAIETLKAELLAAVEQFDDVDIRLLNAAAKALSEDGGADIPETQFVRNVLEQYLWHGIEMTPSNIKDAVGHFKVCYRALRDTVDRYRYVAFPDEPVEAEEAA